MHGHKNAGGQTTRLFNSWFTNRSNFWDCLKTNRHKTVVERYIQLKGCKFVDEIVPYATEQDLDDILRSSKLIYV
jgi:hypothetical protein